MAESPESDEIALKWLEIGDEEEIIDSSDPNNEVIKSVKVEIVQGRHDPNLSVTVSQMMGPAFNVSADKENRETAMNNLFVLARDEAGAEEIFQNEGISKITQLVKLEENEKLICSAIRIVGELCKNNIDRTESVMKYAGWFWCLEMMNSANTERINASQSCLQIILNTYSGMNKRRPKPDMSLCVKYKSEIYTILLGLLNSVTSRTITALAREAIIKFITHNMHHASLNWAEQLVDFGGLQKLMEVASEMEEYKYKEFSMNITSSTRSLISVCLAKIYENMGYKDDKRTFTNTIYEFIRDKLLQSDTESKVRGVVAIITLIFGPFKVADEIIFKEGMIERILTVPINGVEINDVLHLKVVCECIVAAVTQYNKTNKFIFRSLRTLRYLYRSQEDKDNSIEFQALVGMWISTKFGDKFWLTNVFIAGGYIDVSNMWAFKFLRLLITGEKSIKIWAMKGLSYLSFHIKVKHHLIQAEDEVKHFVQVMNELTKTDDQLAFYAVIMTLVNLCNAYEAYDLEGDPIPEVKQLIKFISYYFPEKYLAKDDDLAQKRRRMLTDAGVTSVLAALAKTNSESIKELVAGVFVSLCDHQEVGEIVARQGGTETLLSLALDGAEQVKNNAIQALLHLARIDLEIAFPSERIKVKVVEVFVNQLDLYGNPFENLEVMSSLCKLASVDDNMRKHIVKKAGFETIEDYIDVSSSLYDYNDIVKQKAAELLNNLVVCSEVAVQYGKQDLGLLFTAYKFERDQVTHKEVVGTVARLTEVSKEACKKMLLADRWLEYLHFFLVNRNDDLRLAGTRIALNMMESTIDVAVKLIKRKVIMDELRSLELSKNDTVQNAEIKRLAYLALNIATELEVEGYVEIESSDSEYSD